MTCIHDTPLMQFGDCNVYLIYMIVVRLMCYVLLDSIYVFFVDAHGFMITLLLYVNVFLFKVGDDADL